jgi:hypothetical protein
MEQVILRFWSNASNICLLYKLSNTVFKTLNLFISPKKYITKGINRLLPYLNYVNRLSVTLCLQRYTLQKSCGDNALPCGTKGSEANPPFVCTQHLQKATSVIQLHTAKCVTKAPICSLLLQLSSSVCHDISSSSVGSQPMSRCVQWVHPS